MLSAMGKSAENLSDRDKRAERIALGLRTKHGIPSSELELWPDERQEFERLGLLCEIGGRQLLTEKGKLLADSVAEAFL